MEEANKDAALIRNLTLFFGLFLLFTDVFFLIMGIVYDMPLMRYVIYVKLVINTTNIFLILRKHYLLSTFIIYTVILGFMITGVVCTGTDAAFQLYAIGMLVCISYNGYLHNRILKKELPLVLMTIIHILCYAGAYIYARNNAPLYDIPRSGTDILIFFNSLASFSIVALYALLFHNVAIRSEEKLEQMAMTDKLTGLYNRHYMLSFMEHMKIKTPKDCWLAILDIDDFKKVNDTYGHNCGDYILHKVAELAYQTCKDCIVCRWGGEEFIILSTKSAYGTDILEKLRKRIADEEFLFEKKIIKVTITVGVMRYDGDMTNDSWISGADEKLYFGKHHGKNQVVA